MSQTENNFSFTFISGRTVNIILTLNMFIFEVIKQQGYANSFTLLM